MAELVLVLSDPVFSREQCSPGSAQMGWRPAPPIKLRQEFGGKPPDFFVTFAHAKTLFGNSVNFCYWLNF